MVWAVLSINIKGGTGKSTVTEHLAYEMRDRGHDVAVMDADIDSANLATRFGATERVDFEGDHIVKPVEKDGIQLYSMENAFEESSFTQSGEFMGNVVRDMVTSSAFDDPDYLIVDCPPGSSDVFNELVRALRSNLLGAISVGIPDAVDDTARLVKVCNHNWVPILGFIENMSGAYAYGEEVMVSRKDSGDIFTASPDDDGEGFSSNSEPFAPFGHGQIEQFANEIGGEYLGNIPLCQNSDNIPEAADDTITRAAEVVESADKPEQKEDNIGEKGFIKNVVKTLLKGFKRINNEIPVGKIQEEFGVEGREPLVIEIEITDAGTLAKLASNFVITTRDGDLKVMRKRKAKRKGIRPEAGMKINSQDLHDAISGEKKVMRSVTGEVITEPYSIIDAVRMGDAEVWGENVTNRLSVLDKILSDVVDMSEVQEVMQEA